LELLAGALRNPAAKRSFHKVMANGYLRFEVSREKALSHLLTAVDAGFVEGSAEAQSMVQIIELAVLLRRDKMARDFTERFLARYPRDQRAAYLANRFNLVPPPMR
jgi:outer membrane protein assembly factor BamD (BamD/ComL family)